MFMSGIRTLHRRPLWVGYGVAVLATALAVPAYLLLQPLLQSETVVIVFPLAVVIGAYVGGLGPGLLATAMGVLTTAFLILKPVYSIRVIAAREREHLVMFAVLGVLISLLSEALHRSRRHAEALHVARCRAEADAAALEGYNQQIARILSSITDCYFALDRQWRIAEINERGAQYFHRKPEEMLGRGLWEIFPGCVGSVFEQRFQQAVARQVAVHFETESCEWKGSWAEIHAYPSPDGLSIYFRDITERRQTEEAMRESERRYRVLFEANPHPMWVYDLETLSFLAVNEAAVRHYGYSREEFLGMTLKDIRPPEDVAALTKTVGELKNGINYSGRWRHRKKDGRLITVEITSHTLHFAGRRAQLVLANDITERERAEEALRLSEDRLRLAAEAANIGIWHRDLVHNRLTWTDKAKLLFGLLPEAEVSFATFLNAVHPEDRQRVQETIAGVVARPENHGFNVEYRVIWPDGSVHWMTSLGRAYHDEAGRAQSTYGVMIDTTDRKVAEAQLEKAKAAAEAANQAKDQFLASLSHELRTPLTPVAMIAQSLAEDASLPPQLHEAFEMISRNVDLEARLIDDLLDLTRIARGKIELNLRAVDAHELIGHASDACYKSELCGKRLRFAIELEAAQHHIHADPARFQQIIWNLLKNAIKFTPAGGGVTVRSRNGAEGQLVIEVSDTGIGIEAEQLPSIFNAFEQGGVEVTRRFGGLGLGLTISKALVDLHGGSISVSSGGKDQGATFTVELRTVSPPVAAPPRPVEPLEPCRPLRILLVEDHESTARVLAQLLRSLNHEVKVADSVAAALALGANSDFDLIISDLGLPDGSGLELMPRLKAQHDLPGIALSGYGTEDDIRKSRDAGFGEHLTKPIGLHTLEAAIARATKQTRAVAP